MKIRIKLSLRHIPSLSVAIAMPEVPKTTSLCNIFAASVEPLAHCQNLASLTLFYRHYFGRCSSEPAQLVPLFFSRGRSTRYSDRLHDFSVTIARCYKDVYMNSFFPCKLDSGILPIECFPLTYYLSGFKSRINRIF